MKKIILALTVMFVSSIVFANTNQTISLNNNLKALNSKVTTNLGFSTKITHHEFASCTVTVTIYWYNEYGVFLGTTSSTQTYSGSSNTSLNCAMAEHLAENEADKLAETQIN
jgi:uncharacterized protein YcfL